MKTKIVTIICILLLFVLLIFLSSCQWDNSIDNRGEIVDIQKYEDKVDVRIRFGINSYYTYVWVKGSDTCKVGQIVKLK